MYVPQHFAESALAPVVVDDTAQAKAHLGLLARTMEVGRAAPWRIEDQPAEFIDGMIKGIVAFALPIARLEGKLKLSQNRGAQDRAGVVAALRAGGEDALADAMDAVEKN